MLSPGMCPLAPRQNGYLHHGGHGTKALFCSNTRELDTWQGADMDMDIYGTAPPSQINPPFLIVPLLPYISARCT